MAVAIYYIVPTYRQKSDKHCTRLVSQKNIESKRVFKTSRNFARPFRMRLYFIMLPSVYIIVFATKPCRTRFLFHIYPKKIIKNKYVTPEHETQRFIDFLKRSKLQTTEENVVYTVLLYIIL